MVKVIFLVYTAEKKKFGKLAIFGPKPWVNLLIKMSIFRLFQSSPLYSLQRHFFVLEYRKTHFPGLYCLKKKLEKMAIFGTKAWVNTFGKMSIFPLYELLVFIG